MFWAPRAVRTASVPLGNNSDTIPSNLELNGDGDGSGLIFQSKISQRSSKGLWFSALSAKAKYSNHLDTKQSIKGPMAVDISIVEKL